MGSILVELWAFMKERKKFWLLPILIMMVIFGGLMVATVLSLGVVPPFYVLIKGLEARWFPEPESDDLREA